PASTAISTLSLHDALPILLSRLAVDRKEQGSGLCKHLLRDAVLRSVEAAEIIGVRALLVHALHDQARAFYAHFDVEPSPTDPMRSEEHTSELQSRSDLVCR